MKKQFSLLFWLFILGSVITSSSVSAQADLDSLMQVWEDHTVADTSRLSAMNDIAWDGYLFRHPDSAFHYGQVQYDFAKDALQRHPDNQYFFLDKMAAAMNTQGASHYLRGNFGKANEYYSRSLKIREDIDDKKGIASTLKNMGIIYSEQSNYSAAVKQFNRCLAIYESIGDKGGIASSYNDLGVAYKSQGLFSTSIDYYTRALKTWDEIGEKKWMGATLNNIGNLYLAQDDYTTAAGYMARSLDLRREIHDEIGMINSLSSLGSIRIEQADSAQGVGDLSLEKVKYAEAEAYFTKALSRAEQTGSKTEASLAMNGLGKVYENTGSHDKALLYYEKSLALREEMGKKSGMVSCLNNIASVYQKKAESMSPKAGRSFYIEAINQAERAQKLAVEVGFSQGLKSSSLLLSTCHKALGNHLIALENHEQYVAIREDLMSEENQREVIRQEYRYAYEKQALTDSLNLLVERQEMAAREQAISEELERRMMGIKVLITALFLTLGITLFIRMNQKRKKLALEAESSELKLKTVESEMKALRSQMNPHFIFNALQSIQTFLINQRTEDAEAYLLKFSKLMRAVLENSMHDEVPIESDKKALELYMQLESIRLKHPFTYDISLGPNIDQESDLIPPLILQPFVENAIWHGLQHKDHAGHISIKIEKQGEDLVCTVHDNGIGRQASGAIIAHASMKKESLGMKITEERLRARNEITNSAGRFEVLDLFSDEGHALGTKVELVIPAA